MSFETLKEWDDWKVVGVESTNVNGKVSDWGIHILTGQYKDTVVVIGELSIEEVDSNEQGVLSFDYDIFHNPHDIPLGEDVDFENMVGDIVASTLKTALDEGNAVLDVRESEQDHPTITLD